MFAYWQTSRIDASYVSVVVLYRLASRGLPARDIQEEPRSVEILSFYGHGAGEVGIKQVREIKTMK